jgi:hypothetical protein
MLFNAFRHLQQSMRLVAGPGTKAIPAGADSPTPYSHLAAAPIHSPSTGPRGPVRHKNEKILCVILKPRLTRGFSRKVKTLYVALITIRHTKRLVPNKP